MLNTEHYTVLASAPVEFDREMRELQEKFPAMRLPGIRKPDARHLRSWDGGKAEGGRSAQSYDSIPGSKSGTWATQLESAKSDYVPSRFARSQSMFRLESVRFLINT
jgi:hypothetical protein